MNKYLRVLISAASIVMLLWFLAPVTLRIVNAGNILGTLICAYFIFRFAFEKTYERLRKFFYRNNIRCVIWRFANSILILFAVYAISISSAMVYFSSLNTGDSSPTAVVLGAQVYSWGPSDVLRHRIYAAENYLNSHPDAVAVVTGGQGSNEPMSEAQSMYELMTSDGISADRIYREDKATNTEQNIIFSYGIIKKNDLDENLAIVTDSYHQLRARFIARKSGIKNAIYAVNADESLTGLALYPTMFVREWIALPFEIIK